MEREYINWLIDCLMYHCAFRRTFGSSIFTFMVTHVLKEFDLIHAGKFQCVCVCLSLTHNPLHHNNTSSFQCFSMVLFGLMRIRIYFNLPSVTETLKGFVLAFSYTIIG